MSAIEFKQAPRSLQRNGVIPWHQHHNRISEFLYRSTKCCSPPVVVESRRLMLIVGEKIKPHYNIWSINKVVFQNIYQLHKLVLPSMRNEDIRLRMIGIVFHFTKQIIERTLMLFSPFLNKVITNIGGGHSLQRTTTTAFVNKFIEKRQFHAMLGHDVPIKLRQVGNRFSRSHDQKSRPMNSDWTDVVDGYIETDTSEPANLT
mmetsp:Transcript_10624/g.14627  ORF Transcript_10624/g.14627 Transcript_10624/m.14627 type:complete len:203 (+) Transcript_10624:379-987(+)